MMIHKVKNVFARLRDKAIKLLGGYTPREYEKLITDHNQTLASLIDTTFNLKIERDKLIDALKSSHILSNFAGVKYSYTLCKYCIECQDCNKDCAHGEDFKFNTLLNI